MPERVRSVRWPETAREPEIIDAEGRRRGGVERLDIYEVLARLPDGEPPRQLPPGTRVGHVHLRVGDLGRTYSFYRDQLGFQQSSYAPLVGYGDLGAGGRLAHRVALNIWDGAGLPPRPPEMAGMDHFTLRFASPARLQRVLNRLDVVEHAEDGTVALDPDGNAIHLSGEASAIAARRD